MFTHNLKEKEKDKDPVVSPFVDSTRAILEATKSLAAEDSAGKEQTAQGEVKKGDTSLTGETGKGISEKLRLHYSFESVHKAFTEKPGLKSYSDQDGSGFQVGSQGNYYHFGNAFCSAKPQAGFKIYVAIDDSKPEDVKKTVGHHTRFGVATSIATSKMC